MKRSEGAPPPDMRDVPERYRRWTLRDYRPEFAARLMPLFDGEQCSLYLHGGLGSGKTCLAAAILRAYRTVGSGSTPTKWGEFVTPDRFRAAMMNFDCCETIMSHWRKAAILVLDDLGSLRGTPHAIEHTVRLICSRYDSRRITVATSNLTLDDLATAIDGRIASRFRQGLVFNMGNKDRREAAV